ncbi:class I SAM-dependent DNA methyltransferase [Mesorhizobium sp. M00.F.Ca.ET.038.03.1.1]|nr:class I SAM-dependent DNA methyltransferase [Mesorhizobium sp. M00.F.Ca.ET.038.03.1.1]
MRLSWNEIRVRAATFAREWKGEGYEKGQTQLFYRDFFEVFGMPVRLVATFEEPVKKLGEKRGFMDLFWKGVLLVEQKSVGLDLTKAKTQALDYFPGLKDADLPRYVLLSDFQSFELLDLEEDEAVSFSLADLPKHVEKLGFILGVQKRAFKDQDPVNIKASELVGKLHDALEESGYTGHDLEQFLVRIVFCLFADDTGIFEPRGIFLDFLENRTRDDGSDLGGWLAQLFQVLDTREDRRAKILDSDLAQFPYVNGDLFKEPLRIPSFDSKMRKRLIDASQFDWSAISPAIFGSLFQSVMNKQERRSQGAHYTTEKNIMKVIGPLFLDDLMAEFARLRSRKDSRRRAELQAFHNRLAELTFFDPACGCGNFLIIAYREIRALEIEVLKELRAYREDDKTMELDVTDLSVVNVDQFYGIEISEFPARIAETAMWMMDHIMNNRLSLEFGQTYVRIPLQKSPHIHPGDALELDWTTVLAPAKCKYVFGNPPFVGAKYQTEVQRAQVRRIAALGNTGGTLDFVAAWFIKAGEYLKTGKARIGFVATNSITQGEQVAQLWPTLFDKCKLEIAFAHRTFAWGSDARGKAHVHVVIIGLTNRDIEPKSKRLFEYADINGDPVELSCSALTAYLFDAANLKNRHIVVQESSRPKFGQAKMISGCQPIDDGHYIFETLNDKKAFLKQEPSAAKYVRPYLSGVDFITGEGRWILALQDATPADLKRMPAVLQRIKAVKAFRAKSKRAQTKAIADHPTRFNVEVIPTSPFLAIPEVSSETRDYIPIGWLQPPVIPSNKLRFILNGSALEFAVLTSAMHMAWSKYVGGRLKSDYQYSIGINYNCFPWPVMNATQATEIERLGKAIIAARQKHSTSTLAELYDPTVMPSNLRSAHAALDRAVDRLYQRAGFSSDRERAEHLMALYENMTAPLATAATTAPKVRRKRVAA